eukprot:323225-Rhodomonas_salina.4
MSGIGLVRMTQALYAKPGTVTCTTSGTGVCGSPVDLGAAFYVGTDQDGSAVPSSADGTAGLSAQVQRFAGARAGCFRMDVAALGVLVEE